LEDIHTYTVKGHWPFPTDMIRYDQATPLGEADLAAITRLSTEHATDKAAFDDVEITLVSRSLPNTKRWESFGWKVTAIPTDPSFGILEQIEQRRRDEDALVASGLAKLTDSEREIIVARMGIHA
jgi:hypothetical protein